LQFTASASVAEFLQSHSPGFSCHPFLCVHAASGVELGATAFGSAAHLSSGVAAVAVHMGSAIGHCVPLIVPIASHKQLSTVFAVPPAR
jgi:hypothetical protein